MTDRKRTYADGGLRASVPASDGAAGDQVLDGSSGEPFSNTLIGYVRVSTDRQDYTLQLDAVREAGAGKIFEDVMSGRRDDRPGLGACLTYLRAGDTLVVYSLSRLARSVRHMLELGEELKGRQIELWSLTEAIDTRSPTGRFTFTVLAAVAELERDILVERTRAGLEAARARGRVGGRPRVMTAEAEATARQLRAHGARIATIAKTFNVSRPTIYRVLNDELRSWG